MIRRTAGALVGGDDEVYALTPLDAADRLRTVRKILLMHPSEPWCRGRG